MTEVVLIFKAHQPFRIRPDFPLKRRDVVRREDLLDYYFDSEANRSIFERVSRKCYLPANGILLRLIDEYRRERKRVKVAFSISGTLLDQCELYDRDVLDSFRQLAETGCVELLCQTYYHSLASLLPDLDEFVEQVELHRRAVKDLLGFDPKVFENTELIFDERIARRIEALGFTGIVAEGAERVLGWRSPNYVYRVRGCERLRVLLRNYRLSDDIAFRFSRRDWEGWPLTADRFAAWLEATPGQCIVVFVDYETFGEHHWPESGIHAFLEHLPREILKRERLSMSTPSEVIAKHDPVGEIAVNEPTSWGGTARDLSNWLGNELQRTFFEALYSLAPLVKGVGDPILLRIWRYFQASDHLHSMYWAPGPVREVSAYFSLYRSPLDAFFACQSALVDLGVRIGQPAWRT